MNTRSTGSKVAWTLWMTGGGITITVLVYLVSDSLGWAVVGLLASGVVLNAIAQVVTLVAAMRTREPPPDDAQTTNDPGPRPDHPEQHAPDVVLWTNLRCGT